MNSEPTVVNILGISFQSLNRQQLLATIKTAVETNQRALVLSGNILSFNLAYEQEWLKALFNQADVIRIDGAGLRLGARLLGYQLPERMTWADFAWDLANLCSEQDFSLYLLGGRPGLAEKAGAQLQTRYPSLLIAGIHHGYFNKTSGHPENEAILQQINMVKPDMLIIGFGMPLQEKWLEENRHRLEAKVTLTGGAVFDYISGELHRAPHWLTNNGFEWLGRLIIEPRRLWRRYLIGNPLFLVRVLKQKFRFNV